MNISIYVNGLFIQKGRKTVASDFQWKTAGIETASVGISSVSKAVICLADG